MKKIFSVVIMISIFILSGTKTFAKEDVDIFDTKNYIESYKVSESKLPQIPFIKLFSKTAVFDKEINKSGLSVGIENIEVNERLGGVQILISSDRIKINSNLEYGFLMAPNVVIDGVIEKDVCIVAENVYITDKAIINGDVIALCSSIEQKGLIKGSLLSTSTQANISGTISKDLRLVSDNVKIENETLSGGIYIKTDKNTELNISEKYPNALVEKVDYNNMAQKTMIQRIIDGVFRMTRDILIFAIIFVLFRKLMNKSASKVLNNVVSKPIITLLIGFATLSTIPIVGTILIVLAIFGLGIIAWPLLFSYIGLLVFVMTLSTFIIGLGAFKYFDTKVIKNREKSLALKQTLLFIGTLFIIYILRSLPYVGGYINMSIIMLAMGTITSMIFFKKSKEVCENTEKNI